MPLRVRYALEEGSLKCNAIQDDNYTVWWVLGCIVSALFLFVVVPSFPTSDAVDAVPSSVSLSLSLSSAQLMCPPPLLQLVCPANGALRPLSELVCVF